jgi:hypothetical protein
MWSSPIVFRRSSKNHTLCSDALKFSAEARRRVKRNRDTGFAVGDGDRIQIMGEDVDGKTDDLGPILRTVDASFSTINGKHSSYFSAYLLAPINAEDDDELDEFLAKNQSSVIMNITLAANAVHSDGAKFLTGGDAEVFIWSLQWRRHKDNESVLEYDLLQAPHHCSWHSLSEDSWSDLGEDVEVDTDAREALSRARSGAIIVASCKPILDDDCDPPCIRAKREYVDIVNAVKGQFFCTGEYPKAGAVEPLEFTVGEHGLQAPSKKQAASKIAAVVSSARTPLPHG